MSGNSEDKGYAQLDAATLAYYTTPAQIGANAKQVGGSHYKHGGEEHWDRVNRLGMNYFQGAATKYIERCYLKGNVVQDLQKAVHFLEKLIEIEQGKTDGSKPPREYVNQD